jgi:hypothetical protein
MSGLFRVTTKKAGGIGRRLAPIFCGVALVASSPLVSVQSDGSRAGQARTQLATGLSSGSQDALPIVKGAGMFSASSENTHYVCSPSGAGQGSICGLRK